MQGRPVHALGELRLAKVLIDLKLMRLESIRSDLKQVREHVHVDDA
jgi:hypothetical protein